LTAPHPIMIASDVEFLFAASGEPLAIDGMPFIFRAEGRTIEEVTQSNPITLTTYSCRKRERETDLQTI
jgi:hypothetical protein